MKIINLVLSLVMIIAIASCGGGATSNTDSGGGAISSITGGISGDTQADVTVTLTSSSTVTSTVTNTSGNYLFDHVVKGNYTITPSKTGYLFNPVSSISRITAGTSSVNSFTATANTAPTHTISGTVSGTVTKDVLITLNGDATGSVFTDASGNYTFSGLVAGSYTVTPSLSGYKFTPANSAVTISNANSTGNNFVSTTLYNISGTVGGAVKQGVRIDLTGAATANTTTDANGAYSFTGLANGSYTITPSKSGYTFNPFSVSVSVNGGNVSAANITASTTGGGGSGLALQFAASYNLGAFVDLNGGTLTNVHHTRIAAFGGSPQSPSGYTWTYSLGAGLPTTISIDSSTGLIQGTFPPDFILGPPGVCVTSAQCTYDLTVTVSDGSTSVSSATGDIRLIVQLCNSAGGNWTCGGAATSGPYPQGQPVLEGAWFTPSAPDDLNWEMSLTTIHVNQPFGYALPFGGGTPPYSFQMTSGALPPGLTLNSQGTILGTPTSAAIGNTYTFAVTLTDSQALTSVGYYSMGPFAP